MKKLAIIGGVIVVLFIAIILLTNLSNQNKLSSSSYNPYDKTDLKQSTIDLLDNENYQHIILPDDLKAKIDSGEPVLAYMFSPECPHCMNFTPKLMPLAEEVGVEIYQYNLLEYEQGWKDYNVEYTPTLIFFKDGKQVGEPLVGDYSSNLELVKQFLEQAKK